MKGRGKGAKGQTGNGRKDREEGRAEAYSNAPKWGEQKEAGDTTKPGGGEKGGKEKKGERVPGGAETG